MLNTASEEHKSGEGEEEGEGCVTVQILSDYGMDQGQYACNDVYVRVSLCIEDTLYREDSCSSQPRSVLKTASIVRTLVLVPFCIEDTIYSENIEIR